MSVICSFYIDVSSPKLDVCLKYNWVEITKYDTYLLTPNVVIGYKTAKNMPNVP